MRIYTRGHRYVINNEYEFPCLVLVIDNWDDYGFKTFFTLYFHENVDSKLKVGDVKILDIDNERTELNETFTALPQNQISLGQSIDYYVNLRDNLKNEFENILEALNDVAVNQDLRNKFENHLGFKKSLLRSSEAEKVLEEAKRILINDEKSLENKFNFTYSMKLESANDKHVVEFDFVNDFENDFRTIVLIGKNGTGKTQCLANLAASLCNLNFPGTFIPSRPLFSKVIAISFSLFDKFKVPKTSTLFSYKYIGFRKDESIMSDEELSSKLINGFAELEKQNRLEEWIKFVGEIIDLDNIGIVINSLEDYRKVVEHRADLLSSGQSILIFIITELIANFRRDSIILFDEPETHLHPNAIAKLIKVLNQMLTYYQSYAILATHSPIVVQETPSINVRVFDRIGNTPLIKPLPMESFGENISKITDTIFYRDQVKEVFKEFFDEKIKEFSIDQINEKFNNDLSFNALLYLNSINKG